MMGFKIKMLADADWKHSYKDFKIVVERKNIPETPFFEIQGIKIAGRDGVISQKRIFDTRVITLECSIKDILSFDTKRKIMDFTKIAIEKLAIVFDDKPDLVYFVELSSAIDPDRIIRNGKFIIEFTSYDGFRYSIDKAGEIILDSDITLNNDILLDEDTEFSSITATRNLEINNAGTYEVRPVIILEGSCDVINISSSGITTTYKNLKVGETVYIDCNEYTITKKVNNDVTNALPNWWGDFIYLRSGINDIQITGTNLNITRLKFDFRHTFL